MVEIWKRSWYAQLIILALVIETIVTRDWFFVIPLGICAVLGIWLVEFQRGLLSDLHQMTKAYRSQNAKLIEDLINYGNMNRTLRQQLDDAIARQYK